MTADLTDRAPADRVGPGARPRGATRWRTHLTAENCGFAALLVGTSLLYLIGLSANGWGNSFYSAAIQAGSQSWKAWFFGASDAAGSITVDKLPMSLWIPGISVRIFGLNSWAILVPQALMGVASVACVYLIVRKRFSFTAAMIAGAVLALTPVATMMFRFNNPDALLLLLIIGAVWTTIKALEDERIRWMLLTGIFIGFAFLTKQLQAFLVIPALAVIFLAFGPGTWLRRLGQLFAGLGAMVISAGWWVLAVAVWPKNSRPWIGGSKHNSVMELTMGYNGLGRITGNEHGGMPSPSGRVGAPQMGAPDLPGMPGSSSGSGMHFPGGGRGGPGGGFGGETGLLRMFNAGQGGQIAWLIPAALILGLAVIVMRWKAPRTDIKRAIVALALLWLLVTMLVFSYMSGIFHAYYTIALAPPIAMLVGIGAVELWDERAALWARIMLAASSIGTGVLAFSLLDRSPDFLPWLRWTVLIGSIVTGLVLLIVVGDRPNLPRLSMIAALSAIIFGLAAPAAYSIETTTRAVTGSIPSAGPSAKGGSGFGPGGRGGPDGGNVSADVVALLKTNASQFTWTAATVGSMEASGYQLATQHSVMPIGGFSGGDPSPTLAEFQTLVSEKKIHYFIAGGGFGPRGDSEISTWVKESFTPVTVGGVTLYDLTNPVH